MSNQNTLSNEDEGFNEVNIDEEPNYEPTVISNSRIKDAEIEEIIADHGNTSKGQGKFNDANDGNSDGAERFTAETIPNDTNETKGGIALNGKFLLFITDTAIPIAIKYGIEFSDKTKVVDLQALKMDDEELAMMAPSAEEVARILFANLTPTQQFLIGLGVIYSSKIPEAVTEKPKS